MKACSVFLLSLAILALIGCFYMPDRYGEIAQANLALIMKKPVAEMTSAAIIVTAPDMGPIYQLVSPDASELSIEVPSGTDRTFTILINTVSATFSDQATVDLEPDNPNMVTLYPELTATQIVVPDWQNLRIVQISDMVGSGWTEKTMLEIGLSSTTFFPNDVDFDAEGRIYFSNGYWSTPTEMVARLDSIDDTAAEVLVNNDDIGTRVPAIAVDRVGKYLYYADDSFAAPAQVHRKALGPPLGFQVNFDVAGEPQVTNLQISGLAVDGNGILYITNIYDKEIIKYDPSLAVGNRVLAKYNDGNVLADPKDVIVKSGYIYVVNRNAQVGYSFLQFDKDLNLVGHFGKEVPGPPEPPASRGEFHGPLRFVAPLNSKFHILDQFNPEVPTVDRIVSFSGMSGAGWATYGKTGSGIGEFHFEE